MEDEALRQRALQRLGVHAPEPARAALESGVVEVESHVTSWEGTSGRVHGHRVSLGIEPGLAEKVKAAPSTIDALTAALAAGMQPGNALVELVIVPRSGAPRATAYRGRL